MLYSLRSHVQMARQRLEKLPAGNEDRTPPAGERVEEVEK